MRTRIATFLISAVVLVFIIGCGSSRTTSSTTSTTTTTAPGMSPGTTTPTSSPTTAPTTSPTPAPTPSPTPTPSAAGPEFLYFNASPSGNLYGYQINMSSGALTPVSSTPTTVKANTGGSANCTVGCDRMLLADPQGKFLFFDYSDTSGVQAVAPFTVSSAGALSQTDFHHTIGADINIDPNGRFLYARGEPNNQNAVAGMSLNRTTGTLTDTPGSPYSFSGQVSYMPPAVSNSLVYTMTYCGSLTCGPIINGWSIDQNTGALTPLPTSPASGNGPGMLAQAITPNGQFLYSEQQYADSGGVIHYEIVGFRVNSDGSLTPLSFAPQQTGDNGITQLLMSPNGNFLLHVANSEIQGFAIDPATGALTPNGHYGTNNLGWVAIDPTVHYAYASAGNRIIPFSVDPNTGVLTFQDVIIGDTTAPETVGTMAIVGTR